MSDNAIGFLVFVCIFGAALLGMLLRPMLSQHHLSADTKDSVKLGIGLVATMAALILGLLVAAAKNAYDTEKRDLDGYDLTDALAGKAPSPRKEFFYFNDNGSLVALRFNQWKIVFVEQRAERGFDIWQDPFVTLRWPRLFNIRTDPFEEAEHSWEYWKWRGDRAFVLVPAQQYVGQFLATFKEFPPGQKVGSFSLDQVLQSLQQGGGR